VGTLLLTAALTAALAACATKKEAGPTITTATVDRRTITVDAQATGAVEPINVIEVKSKASGQIVKMTVETGTLVNAGDLLVQVDTRDVKNQYDQANADLRSAQASLEVATAAKKRADELYKSRIITTPEFESAQLAFTQAQGQIVRTTANLDLAKQRLEDATVVAPVSGTIIDKPVSLGQVIASATGSVTGGTTLLKMADLTRVRVRALVNETDIGNVRAGQPARVTVDAYPDRPFQGMVEKIEPQAVVQQSVTMFPVIISLDNNEGFLKPGMNGEVSMIVDRRDNVLAVANDAVRTVREAATAATFVGLNPDSVQAQVRAMQAQMGGGRGGGAAAGTPAGDAPAAQAVDAQSGAAGRGAGRSGAAGRGTGRSGGGMGATGGKSLGAGMAGGRPGGVTRTRTALVFVQIGVNKYEPRLVKLGASNYDYAEVLSGLKEGDKVALLAVQALQAKRDQQNDRMRSMTGSGVPGMQRTPAAGGAAGAGAPAGGGAASGGAPAGGGGARPPGGGR
jgi:HlyD family secretion protein